MGMVLLLWPRERDRIYSYACTSFRDRRQNFQRIEAVTVAGIVVRLALRYSITSVALRLPFVLIT